MRIYLGRHDFGLAAIFFGLLAFVWQDFNSWQQIQVSGMYRTAKSWPTLQQPSKS